MDRRDSVRMCGPLHPALVFDEARMVFVVDLELVQDEDEDEQDEERAEQEEIIPARWELCSTCEGRGTHVNPGIDAHGITQEERDNDWDDEDWQGYLDGRYDVTCYECGGLRVAPVLDEARATPAQVARWAELCQAHGEDVREREHQARYQY